MAHLPRIVDSAVLFDGIPEGELLDFSATECFINEAAAGIVKRLRRAPVEIRVVVGGPVHRKLSTLFRGEMVATGAGTYRIRQCR